MTAHHFNLLILMLFPSLALAAPQQTSHEVHHVIILIDRSGSMLVPPRTKKSDRARIAKINLPLVRKLVEHELYDLCFREDRFLKSRALLDRNRGDYLSIISFGKGSWEKSLDNFIQDVPSPERSNLRYQKDFGSTTLDNLGLHIENPILKSEEANYKFFNRGHSLISMAMPLALHELRGSNGSVVVHRTFVVLITDNQFNGGDPNLELQKVGLPSTVKNKAMATYRAIQSTYAWSPLSPNKAHDAQAGPAKVRIFEFVPIAQVFAIESLIRFNSESLLFERKPGFYQGRLEMSPIQGLPDFHIAEIHARLVDANNQIVANHEQMLPSLSKATTLSFDIENRLARTDLFLDLRFKIDWREQSYGIHQLHPDGTNLQGARGLVRRIPASYEEPLKIWGTVTIGDWLYSFTAGFVSDSQQAVQTFWEAMSVGLIVLIFIALLIKLGFYLRNRLEITEEQIHDQEISHS